MDEGEVEGEEEEEGGKEVERVRERDQGVVEGVIMHGEQV
jgi:hypothetical protein